MYKLIEKIKKYNIKLEHIRTISLEQHNFVYEVWIAVANWREIGKMTPFYKIASYSDLEIARNECNDVLKECGEQCRVIENVTE